MNWFKRKRKEIMSYIKTVEELKKKFPNALINEDKGICTYIYVLLSEWEKAYAGEDKLDLEQLSTEIETDDGFEWFGCILNDKVYLECTIFEEDEEGDI